MQDTHIENFQIVMTWNPVRSIRLMVALRWRRKRLGCIEKSYTSYPAMNPKLKRRLMKIKEGSGNLYMFPDGEQMKIKESSL